MDPPPPPTFFLLFKIISGISKTSPSILMTILRCHLSTHDDPFGCEIYLYYHTLFLADELVLVHVTTFLFLILISSYFKVIGNGKIDIFKELTPHSRTYELRGQGKKIDTKSRQTNTSHCTTKTISKTDTVPLNDSFDLMFVMTFLSLFLRDTDSREGRICSLCSHLLLKIKNKNDQHSFFLFLSVIFQSLRYF